MDKLEPWEEQMNRETSGMFLYEDRAFTKAMREVAAERKAKKAAEQKSAKGSETDPTSRNESDPA